MCGAFLLSEPRLAVHHRCGIDRGGFGRGHTRCSLGCRQTLVALFEGGCAGAVSVGIVNGVPVLDLDYPEDSGCECDMNVVMNEAGQFVEVQGTAEGHAFRREELDALLDLAGAGIRQLIEAQRAALGG